MAKKAKRVAICFDPHGSDIDWDTANAFLDFVDWYKPHIRIIGGDLYNFDCLRTGANAGDESTPLADDIEAAEEFAHRFFKGNCRTGTHVWILGNHDVRPWKRLRATTRELIKEACRDLIKRIEDKARLWNCQLIPYDHDGVYELTPKWRILHGIHHGYNAVRQHVYKYSRNVIHGHIHGQQFIRTDTYDRLVGITPGLIGNTRMTYAKERAATMAWENGWLYGEINGDDFDWQIARRQSNGKFAVAEQIRYF